MELYYGFVCCEKLFCLDLIMFGKMCSWVGTFVWSILNLEPLISISNVGNFKSLG